MSTKPPKKGKRANPTKAVEDQVLNEFNYLCALCGAIRPQLHHIDENPANSVAKNLLPLCPNHHLTDQHHPTRGIDPDILAFFRIHKDPFILTPQFRILYRRFLKLYPPNRTSLPDVRQAGLDLIRFVLSMEMGHYYGEQLKDLVHPDAYPLHIREDVSIADPQLRLRDRERQQADYYFGILDELKTKAIEILLELIQMQSWSLPENLKRVPPYS